MSAQKWFDEIDVKTPSEQGIILEDFEWFDFKTLSRLRTDDGSAIELRTLKQHVIILSQSCDLIKPNTKYVHVCPVYTLSDMFQIQGVVSHEDKQELFDKLKRNSIVSRHLTNTFQLSTPSALEGDYLVVDFGKAIIVPMGYVKRTMLDRSSHATAVLNIPYRESMAQRYGQYFSRIGNPTNLDAFEDSIHVK